MFLLNGPWSRSPEQPIAQLLAVGGTSQMIGLPTQFHIVTYAPLHPCPLPIHARFTLCSDVGLLRPMQSNRTPVAQRWCVSLIECWFSASQSRNTFGPA